MFTIVFSLFLFELTARVWMMVSFQTPFFSPSKILYKYYPILENIKEYNYNNDKINVLVLGGSVVYNDTIVVGKDADAFLNMPGTSYSAHFCALDQTMDSNKFNVLSLAMSAHNSLDSWYKYKYCKKLGLDFDYIFVYHGINDQRTNNIWQNRFDDDYRHVEFYDDLYVINHHSEINITAIPFMLDWIKLSFLKKKQGLQRYISKDIFMGLLKGNPEPHVLEGKEIKTAVTFRRNYENIIQLAEQHQEKVVLSTYAWNLPLDYDFKKFYNKELPYYQEQLFPTELYGMPNNIRNGLQIHNNIVRELSVAHPNLPFIDMDKNIPDSSTYFNDVCHLTDEGCSLMASKLSNLLQ